MNTQTQKFNAQDQKHQHKVTKQDWNPKSIEPDNQMFYGSISSRKSKVVFTLDYFLNTPLNFSDFPRKPPQLSKSQNTPFNCLFLNLARNGINNEVKITFLPLPPHKKTRARHLMN